MKPKPIQTMLSQATQMANHASVVIRMRLNPRARVPKLEVRAEADAPPVLHELVGDHYTLGRSSRCDIVVQTPLVSQIHAELVRDSQKRGAGFFLRDKDSTNGIYRQRQKVTAVPLRHNLRLTLGPPELQAAPTLRFIDPPPLYLRVLKWTGIGISGAIATVIAAMVLELQRVPSLRPLPVSQQGPVEVLDGEGRDIGPDAIARHTEARELGEFGEFLPKAVVASEDTAYYWHIGVDPFSVARAIIMNVRAGRLREGGSTITQQLARNLLGSSYVGREDSAGRKWREAAAAIKLNFTYPKDEILTIYLNRVYLGNGVYGFQDAARLYFGKSPRELDLSEAATLVGILPEPETANPFRNKNRALEYRDRVLNRMADLGMVPREEAERARRSILRLKEENKTELQGTIAPYFYSYVFEELEQLLGDRFALEGNLIVETNLDPKMQRASDRAVQTAIQQDGQAAEFSQGAIITVRHDTGEIVAMTGGRDYRASQFNRATQARRQPGSTFKLFAYAAAVNQGISPFTTFPCTSYLGVAGCRRGNGAIDMVTGFALSENVVALRVAEAAGLGNVIRTARSLGVTAELKEDRNLALGGFEVSMLEMVGAYGAIANNGTYIKPHAIRRIRDSADCQDRKRPETCRVVFDAQRDLSSRRALSGDIAAAMQEMMRQVVSSGTGTAAQIPQAAVQGKTGTTDNARDLWFIGSVPSRQLTTAVWLGNDEGVTNGSSAIAASVFHQFLSQALDET